MFCSRLPGLKDKTHKSGVVHIVGTRGKPAASRVLPRKHCRGAKRLWVCLLIPHKSLAHPESWPLLFPPPLPGMLQQRAGILAPSKHNHICSISTLPKELSLGWVGLQQPLGVPAIPPHWSHLQHCAQMFCSARGSKQLQTQAKAPGVIATRMNGLLGCSALAEALQWAPGGSVF